VRRGHALLGPKNCRGGRPLNLENVVRKHLDSGFAVIIIDNRASCRNTGAMHRRRGHCAPFGEEPPRCERAGHPARTAKQKRKPAKYVWRRMQGPGCRRRSDVIAVFIERRRRFRAVLRAVPSGEPFSAPAICPTPARQPQAARTAHDSGHDDPQNPRPCFCAAQAAPTGVSPLRPRFPLCRGL
jgi:hypothetical protein